MGWNAYKGSGQKGYWSGAWPRKGKGDDKKDVNKDKNKSKKEGDVEFPAYSSLERSSSSATTPSVDSKQIKEAVAAYLVEHGLQSTEEAAKVLEAGPMTTEIQAEQKSLNSRKKVTQKLEKLKSRLVAKKKAWVQFQERLDAHRKAQKEVYESEVKELEKEIETATQELETMLKETGRLEPGDLGIQEGTVRFDGAVQCLPGAAGRSTCSPGGACNRSFFLLSK